MKKDLRARIAEGEFTSTLDYGYTQRSRKAWRDDTERLVGLFKQALLEELNIVNHPEAETLWKMAWNKGQATSLYEVLDEAELSLARL